MNKSQHAGIVQKIWNQNLQNTIDYVASTAYIRLNILRKQQNNLEINLMRIFLFSSAIISFLLPSTTYALSTNSLVSDELLTSAEMKQLENTKVNVQHGTLTSPSVQDWINTPYLAIPDFYITSTDKAAGNWGPALKAAIADVVTHGGGTVRLLPHAYHVIRQSLHVPAGVTIEGAAHITGVVPNNDYRTLPYSLLIDPDFTISLTFNTSLRRLVIVSSHLGLPKNNADMVSELELWERNGTAITASGTNEDAGNAPSDIELTDLFIMGFNQAIHTTYAERMRIDNVSGDNISGISMDFCLDICRISNVHWNSFINYHTYLGGEWFPVSSITNNGAGNIRITLPPGYVHDLQTGWSVTAFQGDGQNNPGNIGGKYTVKRINNTQFDLLGSKYINDVTGGNANGSLAKIFLDNSSRKGIGFSFTHSAGLYLINNFASGYRVGFEFGNEAQWPFCINNSVDGYLPAHDPERIGVLVTGSARRMQWTGGYISSTYDPFKFSGSDNYPHNIANVNIGATYNSAINIESGRILAIGNTLSGGAPIYIGTGSSGISMFIGALENSQVINKSRYTPVIVDSTTATATGLNFIPLHINKLALLPACDVTHTGQTIYVANLRKPNERSGAGTGGNVICSGIGAGKYGWVSQFLGILASE